MTCPLHTNKQTHFVLPCQFRFARLSLVRTTPLRRYYPNTFIRNGIFNFQSLLLLIFSIDTSGKIRALYIEATENLPFLCKFQWNSSCPGCSWICAKRWWRGFNPTMPMFRSFDSWRERGRLADLTASERNRGTQEFTQVCPLEGKDLHPACLILYCWYNWSCYNGAQMGSGYGRKRDGVC
jgi:hypothetical protein